MALPLKRICAEIVITSKYSFLCVCVCGLYHYWKLRTQQFLIIFQKEWSLMKLTKIDLFLNPNFSQQNQMNIWCHISMKLGENGQWLLDVHFPDRLLNTELSTSLDKPNKKKGMKVLSDDESQWRAKCEDSLRIDFMYRWIWDLLEFHVQVLCENCQISDGSQ